MIRIDFVRDSAADAIRRFGKSRVARAAGISESSLRDADRPGWNPTVDMLRKLEIAAAALALAGKNGHPEAPQHGAGESDADEGDSRVLRRAGSRRGGG